MPLDSGSTSIRTTMPPLITAVALAPLPLPPLKVTVGGYMYPCPPLVTVT